jgi:Trypsin-like peptidase domain
MGEPHHHTENPWRVRIDDEQGNPRGAGVLLDRRNVLTCAHVIKKADAAPGGAASGVRITSVDCRPEWTRTATVDAGSWVYRNETRRGDVALLELDRPAPCDAGTKLWLAPISGGRVRVYGFPAPDPYGISVDAELAGSGSREGEWGVLNQVAVGRPWIEEGFSGAGVVALDGDFKGRVIGIVVARYAVDDAKAAWMLPTETIRNYLSIAQYVDGEQTAVLSVPGGAPSGHRLTGPRQLALTQELTRLLSGGWAGTVVITGGAAGAGDSWLTRLVNTADPGARTGLSDAELARAPQDTVLGLGAVDAAYDARGRSSAEVLRYLTDRFGPSPKDSGLLDRLLHRAPPVCLVIGGVDRATDPQRLVDGLLRPLASRAWARGIRLVLEFDGRAPAGLAHEVALGPETAAGAVPAGTATRQEAQADVERLTAREKEAADLRGTWALRFFGSPSFPSWQAPRLRVRLAVARGPEPNAELAAVRDAALAAVDGVERYGRRMRRLVDRYEDLCQELEVHRLRAARFFGAEDLALADLYGPAADALRAVPVDLSAADAAVKEYENEVNRRIAREGDGGHAEGERP